MKSLTSDKLAFFSALVVMTLFGAVMLIGCGTGPQPVDQSYVQAATDRSAQAHDIYTSANGDLTKVSDDDRAKLVKLFGSQSEVERIWNNMAHPAAGGLGADKQGSTH